jgi:two-component system chemotaxis sensor kinase CheA
MAINAEILEGFRQESVDLIDDIEPRLIGIAESSAADQSDIKEDIDSIFRAFHTIKGVAASIGLELIPKVTHEAETMLVLFREGEHPYKPDYTEILCETTDLLRKVIEELQDENSEMSHENAILDLTEKLKEQIQKIKNGDTLETCLFSESDKVNATTKKFKDDNDPELITQFISDGFVFISSIREALISLKENNQQKDLYEYVYRETHSLKGNCSLMGYTDLENMSLAIEKVLTLYRDGTSLIGSNLIDCCLKHLNEIKEGLNRLKKGEEPIIKDLIKKVELVNSQIPDDHKNKAASSENLLQNKKDEASKTISDQGKKSTVCVVEDSVLARKKIRNLLESQNYKVLEACDGLEALDILRENKRGAIDLVITDLGMPRMDGFELVRNINLEFREIPILILSGADDVDIFKKLIGHDLSGYIQKNTPRKELFSEVKRAIDDGTKKKLLSNVFNIEEKKDAAIKARNDIRVDMRKLDAMINLVGELIIAEALVTSNPEITNLKINSFTKYSEQLRNIIEELHDVTLSLRMVPVEGLFKKMIRVVHDASKKTDKKVKLETFGVDTELDKIVTDVLSDPLVHMIRNSVDHGIESQNSRIRKKKGEQGIIKLGAEQKGNEVTISIQDDGAGLDRNKILQKAIDKKIVDPNNAEALSDKEVFQIIFNPGFSTSETVTDLSGRGVGMDVVKKNIESINGHIDIESELDKGSAFNIRIPLNLATMEGMLFRVGESKYTIPISCIRETFRLEDQSISIRSDDMEYVNLRNEVHPILRLHEIHDIEPRSNRLQDGILIVLDVSEGTFCLFVDEMLYQMDTVIKNFSGFIDDLPTICGCNILGDGKISLILNVDNIIRMMKKNELITKKNRENLFVIESTIA